MEKRRAIYTDKYGRIEGELGFDGATCHLSLENCAFTALFMDGFEPTEDAISPRFEMDVHNALTNFTLAFELPMRFRVNGQLQFLDLSCDLCVKLDGQNESRPYLRCKLNYKETELLLPHAGTIEGAIKELNALLPYNMRFIGCYNCKFSDYSIYGQQFWGSMLCFKNIKEKYSTVKDKDAYMEVMDEFDEIVPENHFCDFFEQRPSEHTGYRG